MKKHLILFLLPLFVLGTTNLFGQVIVYSEDFDGPPTWTINTDLTGEDANPNVWYVSCEEEGVGEGNCGTACGPGNQTLHVGPDALLGDIGAAYAETGTGLTGTNRRAESGDINTVGETDLTLHFDMIGAGNADDFCEVFYSIDGGLSWTSIDGPLVELCCGGVICSGAEQGLWAERVYPLPVECEGIPNLRISFVWQNVDDGVATDPSFAVDNITIETPVVVVDGGPTALFYPEDTTICQGESLTYTDMSLTDDVITDWNWVFDGGDPTGAMTAGPHVVTYTTPGVYVTTLTVTDGIGSHDTSFTVTVLDGPYAGESTSADLCVGETLDLNTLIPGADAGGTWTETTIPASGGFTPGTGELDGTGLTGGDVFTFEYETLPGAPPCDGTDIATITITMVDCEALNASFTFPTSTICEGDCIDFVNESTGTGITGYVWTFSDPDIPGPIAMEDPGTICFPNVGDVDVTLTITDGTDFDDTTVTITVSPLPDIVATATAETICVGAEVTLSGTGGVVYNWTGGVENGVPFTLDATTTYTVTGTNAFGCENTDDITITVIDCEPIVAGFDFDNIICVGDCITFRDTSQGDPQSWLWDFGGAVDPPTSTEQNPVICFDNPGIFDIQLTVTNIIGETSSTTNSITIFVSPTVDAELDTIIDLGGQAALVAVGSLPEGDYIWSPDDYIGCENCSVTTASPPEDMEYIVTFTDVNGCSAVDTVQVFVNFIEAVAVPDAFSPNGDGTNDVLYVKGFGLESIVFSIYNKYGEKVFESRTQDIGWDGTFKGRDQNPGVFTWVLEYQFINGNSNTQKGNTTLIR